MYELSPNIRVYSLLLVIRVIVRSAQYALPYRR